MKDLSLNRKTRRNFLKNASKTSIAVAVGGLALAGCGNTSKQNSSSTKKTEILYRSTKYWSSYYASAK